MHPNPIIWVDYPDLDVIRVDNTYYMVSTTMHMMPGCVILRSYDLIHWEVATHVYDALVCRIGLFLFSTREIGGTASFASFIYNVLKQTTNLEEEVFTR